MISLNNNLITSTLKRREVLIVLKQIRKASRLKVSDPREKALKHFDDFYKAVFVNRWPSIRLGLLSKQKYVVVLNNFTDVKETEEFLEREGAFDLLDFTRVQKANQESAESDVESFTPTGDKIPLEEIILAQAQEEEIKELKELHPEGREFKSKVDSLSREDEEKDAKDVLYKPEDARTSLRDDLLSSQIDMSRLIEPDSVSVSSLQEFIPATILRGLEDYVPESEYYKYYQVQTGTPITVEKEHNFEFPEKLKVYTFDRGDISEFPEPVRDIHNAYTYLKVEGSDLLTALVLGVQPEDRVLDLFSLSGSTPYCILQTLLPKVLVCATKGRQTENVFRNHLYDYKPFWREMLMITNEELTDFETDELFDKVLINVPSTEDKRSVLEIEKNIFRAVNLRQRLRLPEQQCMLLLRALKMVRPGGTIVYCTSTLSPIQNEAVVSTALKTAWEENKMEFIVKDLTPALKPISYFYNFEECLKIKYGTLVVPFAPVNFGPKYFCKLVKKE